MTQNTEGFTEIGDKTRRTIIGDEYVDPMLASKTAFDHEWQLYLNNQVWGRTWARGILEHKQMSLINLAMLAGMHRMEEFELHFRIALKRTGVPLIQLREVLLHIGMYCGVAIGRDCFAIARRVLKEEHVDLSVLDEK
ncbi:carboxymuconolactone decarboxylase family protein [Bordetella sp. BOR01]|uniref:carboxymuconolactone decarboxylase family protein n=1 Tax=Bordetella sp. BOR01 TaxID=2854779 RepID=UPI001C4798A0|nr:carboxymuconolactone decarboxylase family protein [Bordetella sp. BOR01]